MSGRFFGVLCAMAALLATGLATGTQIYYALFALLALMVLFALVSVVWTLLTVRVGMKGVRSRVERGEKQTTILAVQHRSLLPAGCLRIILNVPGSSGTQEISACIPPFAKKAYRNVIRCPHRGSFDVGIAGLRASDIFGLFELRRKGQKKLMRVEVYPRVPEAPGMQLRSSDTGPEFISRATEDAASPSDIRKWQDGDELKKIHWKLSLRKRELMVRTFEESARPDTLIIPDLSEISALKDQRLTMEDCICEAALSAAKAQLKAGFPVRMPLQTRRPQELSAKFENEIPAFVDVMKSVAFDCPYAYEDVLSLMLRRMQRTGGAVLITARLTTRIADAAMRMQRSGMQVKLIWVTDATRSETLEMLERLKMAGVLVEQADPWADGGYASVQDAPAAAGEEILFDID